MSTFRKVLLATTALAVLVPATAAAQSRTSTEPWTVGVLGGATMSGIKTDDDVNLGQVWGAQAGVFGQTSITDLIGARVELLVTQRGAKNDVTDNKMRIAYLDVPLLLRVGDTATNALHVHGFTGLTPGFRLKTDTSTDGPLTSDIGLDVKSFDLGWVIGAGVEQDRWGFDVRYTFGLTNANDVSTGAEYKNRSLSLNVSYLIK